MNTLIRLYQTLPEHVSPYIFQIATFQLRWYSIAYILAILTVYWLVRKRLQNEELYRDFDLKFIDDAIIVIVLGLILGARLGYVLIYDPGYFLSNPLKIFTPFSFAPKFHFTGLSGMSYHGGVIGVLIAIIIYTKRQKVTFFKFTELFIPAIPLGYTWGRLGNFMNRELYGRITNSALGMYFPTSGDGRLRHPSQLYEAFFEGIVLFIILWTVRKKIKRPGIMMALYLILHGAIRFVIEFFREPDALFKKGDNIIGTVLGFMTMGQVLCGVMIISGIGIIIYTQIKNQSLPVK